jgi:PAS domain S-box-containing protein
MGKLKKPNLFIRVSHLIIIQILFVFAALTLVFFYPEDVSREQRYYSALKETILADADRLAAVLEAGSIFEPLVFDSIPDVLFNLSGREYYEKLDILYRADSGHEIRSHNLIGAAGLRLWTRDGIEQTPDLLLSAKDDRENLYLVLPDENPENLLCYVRPESATYDYAFICCVKNPAGQQARKELAYILLVLFLTATLISLLIIKLIDKGIKYPLIRLIEGFSRVVAGERHQIEEVGDQQIKQLIQSFNRMSSELDQNRRELEGTNRCLVDSHKNLAESEALLAALVAYSPEAIVVTDLEHRVIKYNYEAASNFGYNSENMIGISLTDLIPSAPQVLVEQDIENEPAAISREVICRRLDDQRFPALMVQVPLGLDNGCLTAVLYFIKDISESAGYQKMILKLDRHATRGRMARDIAHEINNYLTILQGNLELLPLFIAKNDNKKLESKIGIMRETLKKISSFTEGLSHFGEEEADFVKEDINQLIENLIAFLKPQNMYDNVEIMTELADDVPLVEMDAGQIHFLMVNLIRNAVESQLDSESSKRIKIVTRYKAADHVVKINVVDDGPGVEEEYIGGLFKKRLTSKREGTGLGLINCKTIVDNHAGGIAYRRTAENETVFEVALPVERTRPSEKPEAVSADFPAAGQ